MQFRFWILAATGFLLVVLGIAYGLMAYQAAVLSVPLQPPMDVIANLRVDMYLLFCFNFIVLSLIVFVLAFRR